MAANSFQSFDIHNTYRMDPTLIGAKGETGRPDYVKQLTWPSQRKGSHDSAGLHACPAGYAAETGLGKTRRNPTNPIPAAA